MTAHTWVRWIPTGLASALLMLSALPDVLRVPGALTVFHHLGYPAYLLPFLGTAKLLGVAAILAPGFPRLKEWAYAGLTFDVVGALYSHLSVGDPANVWAPAAIGLSLVTASYVTHRNRLDVMADRSLRAVVRGSSSDQVAASGRLG
jgi:uncharacterized membrane protein YphA (DoxX/SURF4 family)